VSQHQFIVTVETDLSIPADDEHGRDEELYAKAALLVCGLPDAQRLDGFADLSGSAWVVQVDDL
jgi:hypothetical protein